METKSLITHTDPHMPFSEAFRMLRTNLYYTNVDKGIKSIVVASANKAEGKTTTAANLAIALALADEKTLYVGADLRKPRGHKIFGLSNFIGLTSVIMDDMYYQPILESVEGVPNLSILTSGPIPLNPSEILQSNAMKRLMEEFKEEFDYVILDVPPINSVTDGSILAAIADGVILTVASNETTKESAVVAVKTLEKVGANILGCVLTKVSVNNNGYYYQYYTKDHGNESVKNPLMNFFSRFTNRKH